MAEARRLGGRPARGKRRGESLLAGGFVLLMLGLVAFAVYQCARHLTVNINTLRTQEITDTAYSDLVLYLFRDEETVTAGGGNVFLYGVRDGEKWASARRSAVRMLQWTGMRSPHSRPVLIC